MRTRGSTERTKASTAAFAVAAGAGVVHGLASMYWALGGRWQLESVGEWAVQLSAEHPLKTGLALGAIAVVKLVAAVVPWVDERHQRRFHRPLRAVGWAGGFVLVGWGGMSTIAAGAVLAGLFTPSGGFNETTMIGHAIVWDPLFALWGIALLTALCLTRTAESSTAGLGRVRHR